MPPQGLRQLRWQSRSKESLARSYITVAATHSRALSVKPCGGRPLAMEFNTVPATHPARTPLSGCAASFTSPLRH